MDFTWESTVLPKTTLEHTYKDLHRFFAGYARAHSHKRPETPYKNLCDLHAFTKAFASLFKGEPGLRPLDTFFAEPTSSNIRLEQQYNQDMAELLVAELGVLLAHIDKLSEESERLELSTFGLRCFLAGAIDASLNFGPVISVFSSEHIWTASSNEDSAVGDIVGTNDWWQPLIYLQWRKEGAPKFDNMESAMKFAKSMAEKVNGIGLFRSDGQDSNDTRHSNGNSTFPPPPQIASIANWLIEYGRVDNAASDIEDTDGKADIYFSSSNLNGEAESIGPSARLKLLY